MRENRVQDDVNIMSMGQALGTVAEGVVVALVAVALWLIVARLAMRRRDAEWSALLARADRVAEEAATLGASGHVVASAQADSLRLAALGLARRQAGRGRPSDRLFLLGLVPIALIALGCVLFALAQLSAITGVS
jgi:hypothetical protein